MDIEEIDTGKLTNFLAEHSKVFVCYYSPKCSMCKLVKYHLHHISHKYPEIKCVKYDIDADPSVRTSLAIQRLPCAFAYRDGKIVCRYFGTEEQQFQQIVEKYLQ